MVNSGLQIFGCVLGCIGGVCNLFATFLPEWKLNESSDLDAIIRYEGLWIKCVTYPSGLWQCESYDDFFINLQKPLQIGRALTCSSIVLAFFAFVATAMGMECTTCLLSNDEGKVKIAYAAATLWLLSGACTGSAASYYAGDVLLEYKKEMPDEGADDKYMYGSCLYLGWASLVICVIGGLLFGFGSLHKKDRSNPWVFGQSPHKPHTSHLTTAFLNTEYV